jgi:hypothetical protein
MKRNRITMDYKNALRMIDKSGDLAIWLFQTKFPRKLILDTDESEDSIEFRPYSKIDKATTEELLSKVEGFGLLFTAKEFRLKCKFHDALVPYPTKGSPFSIPDHERFLHGLEDELHAKEKNILFNFMFEMTKRFPIDKKPKIEVNGRTVTLQFFMTDFYFSHDFYKQVLNPASEYAKNLDKYEISAQDDLVVFNAWFYF